MEQTRPKKLRGYMMPILTPFNRDGSIDEAGMRQNIAYLIKEGIHGITISGSFGEFPLLTIEERIRLYEVATEEISGRCAAVAGTADARTDVVIRLNQAAEKIGMDGVMMTPPHYLRPSERDLEAHFGAIAAATSLPITVYNNPPRTGINMSVQFLVKLSKLERVATIKQSSLDIMDMLNLIDQTRGNDDFFVTNGQEPRALPCLLMGAEANYGISPMMLGAECIALYDHARNGELDQARAIQSKINVIRGAFAASAATPAASLRYLANKRGLAGGTSRLPITDLSAEDKRRLDDVASQVGMVKV